MLHAHMETNYIDLRSTVSANVAIRLRSGVRQLQEASCQFHCEPLQ